MPLGHILDDHGVELCRASIDGLPVHGYAVQRRHHHNARPRGQLASERFDIGSEGVGVNIIEGDARSGTNRRGGHIKAGVRRQGDGGGAPQVEQRYTYRQFQCLRAARNQTHRVGLINRAQVPFQSNQFAIGIAYTMERRRGKRTPRQRRAYTGGMTRVPPAAVENRAVCGR